MSKSLRIAFGIMLVAATTLLTPGISAKNKASKDKDATMSQAEQAATKGTKKHHHKNKNKKASSTSSTGTSAEKPAGPGK